MFVCLSVFFLCQSCIVVSNSGNGKISGVKIVEGEGSIVEVKPECSGFTALDLCAPLEAVVEKGEDYSVSIKGHENLVNLLETEVKGHALVVRLKERCIFKQRVELRVTMPVEVQRLSLASECALSLQQDIDAQSFDIGLSGASSLKCGGSFGRPPVCRAGCGVFLERCLQCVVVCRRSGKRVGGCQRGLRLQIVGDGGGRFRGDFGRRQRRLP